MQLFRIRYETSNFDFESYGRTEADAVAAMKATLVKHSKVYQIAPDWFDPASFFVQKFDVPEGGCGFRDGTQLTP